MTASQNLANYAKGLFKIQGSLEVIQHREKDLGRIAEIVKDYPQMIHLLGCPEMTIQARLDILEKIIGAPLEQEVKQLAGLLVKRGKISRIGQIASDYSRLVVNSLKEIDVEVVSAEPLSEKALEFLRTKLEQRLGQKVVFFLTIDAALLGGFTISVHNQLLDLSIKNELRNLKMQLLKAKL